MLGHLDKKVLWWVGGGGGIAIIVTTSWLQVTLRVKTCVESELSLPESDLELSLLIFSFYGENAKFMVNMLILW